MSAIERANAGHRRRLAMMLRCGASVLALGVAATSTGAWAQTTQSGPVQNTTPDSTSVDPAMSSQTAPATSDQGAPVATGQTTAKGISDSTSTATRNPSDTTTQTGIVVTGVRAALATSQAIKRNADTVVDSITATDINAFPDKSVAEALQRVAGITVSRFAAPTDTVHFSAEPAGVIVRGLLQVRSEFNGRDIFNANSGRGLSFADVPPELMAGVDAYKNNTADMIEGGIAGTINLRTRLPFDSTRQLVAISLEGILGDLARKATPSISGVYSNRWNTGIGEFGFLADIAYSRTATDSQVIQYGHITPYAGFTQPDNGTVPNYGKALVYIPGYLRDGETLYERTRTGGALAAQWRSPDHKILLTGQYNVSHYQNNWHEHYVNGLMGYTPFQLASNYTCTPTDAACGATQAYPYPAPGTAPFTFDSNGVFHSGTMVTGIGWWGNNNAEAAQSAQNSAGMQFVNACYGWNGCTPSKRGEEINLGTRYSTQREVTGDASLNLKWDPTDNLHVNADYQYVHSKVKNYDMTIDMGTFATVQVNQSGDKEPTLNLITPTTNVNLDPGGVANAANYHFHDAMDHLENSSGHEQSFRGDVEYDFNASWLSAIKAGVRYSDREQTVRWSTYNWQNIANEWTQVAQCTNGQSINQAAYYNVTRTGGTGCFTGYRPDLLSPGSFRSSFYGGGKLNPLFFPFFNYAIMEDHDAMAKALSRNVIGVGSWDPLCSNKGARAGELQVGPGSCWTPAEIADVSEKTTAGYLMVKFGGNDQTIFGLRYSGNAGVRYVHTEDVSGGGFQVSALSSATSPCTISTPNENSPPTGIVQYSAGCYIFGGNTTTGVATGLPGQPAERAFANGASVLNTAVNKSNVWLPAFNLKINLTDTLLLRFAASRAMSRPDIGQIKNYTGIGAQLPRNGTPVFCGTAATTAGQPCFLLSGPAPVVQNGIVTNVTGVQAVYTASAYNPFLQPIKAQQFDLSLENYFARVGSVSITGFYKKFENYIQVGTRNQQFTNNGQTRTVSVRGPVNTKGANIYGFETSLQRYFDFLPKPFDGLGVQANFTYVHNSGLSNPGSYSAGDPTGTTSNVNTTLNPGALEQLSKYAYNLIGMYEQGPLALRLAYNWRSTYLVVAQDCCVYYPVWQRSQGFLDGSIRYRIRENIELDLEATNLLNTKTVLEQQVTDVSQGRLLVPSQWSITDRRFQLGVRLKF